ncbi:HAMP domain-containing sensor histidine kinase [Rossellomorea sp. YZS02]|uniref:HAMP domain-containing sensor histidine kinase n=1 Tax=Rossellomorea sp. YZS02 TaxID=3097358 RepID=UPI002A0D3B44|nr:HAMP domain-containing sensor histidine kinase [Rossellomorea sp. YZS02]MDX8343558.1 HAMP domain-containing sensor histidine kinase [Rossellomorea sp. YZS02]
MKEFHERLHKKYYYLIISFIILLMTAGLMIDNQIDMGFVIHGTMVFIISTCLLLYPLYENAYIRYMTVISSTGFFYTLFFLYPETWSDFVLLCFIPAFSILFFDKWLFYFSLVLNVLFIGITFSYIVWMDKGVLYPYIYKDLTGNIVNFIASQILLYFIFHLTDLRMQKQRVYYEQVQQAERMKTTGQLAAAVAHEIRNPLTVVKGFLQYYAEDETLKTKQNFPLMINELDTAEHVISQFLSISKPDREGRVQNVDVEVVLKDVTELLSMYGLLNDNSLQLHVEKECLVSANSIELKQLFINLIKNAIEASPETGSVSITANQEKGNAVIRISDNGRGMSDEEIRSLGTPFYSLKSKGTGLGLMICYNIVEKYNGEINFQSESGKGTTVTLLFPLIHA